MIRIAYIINSIRNNGPSNVLVNMVNAINRNEFEPTIITLINENDRNITDRLRAKNIRIIELNMSKSFSTMFKSKKLKDTVEKGGYDLIHTHSHVPTIMAQNIKCKKITTVHNRLAEDFVDSYGFIKGTFINFLYVNALKQYSSVVCCSKAVYNVVNQKISNSIYIENGINFAPQINRNIRKELSISNNEYIYCFAGALSGRKNVVSMLETMAPLLQNDEHLIILGDGPLLNKIKKFEKKNVHILGFCDNVANYFSYSNVYVSFSKSEGFPLSVIEALSQNLLLLLSDIPSHREFFEIDNSIYIGEFFNENDFNDKLKIIREKMKDRVSTSEFQNKWLSADYMMRKYESQYQLVRDK